MIRPSLGPLGPTAPLVMVAGIGVAVWGQYILLSEREFALRGALLMAGGGLAFLAALLMGWRSLGSREILDEEGDRSVETSLHWGLRQKAGLAAGILGGLGGFFLNGTLTLESGTTFAHSTFTAWGFSLWLLGCLAIVLAFWPPLGRAGFRLPKLHPSLAWVLVVLLFTLGLAAFFRFYDLRNLLNEPAFDHASVVFEIKVVTDGQYPVYFPAGQGREALFFYLGAGLTPFFGHSFLAIKVLTAIVGVLTVAATYFMTRELFGNRRVALISAVLISLSFWHVIISRVGWPVALHPLMVALTLAFLFRGLKYNRSSDFVFAGLFLGLELYTYGAGRVAPVAVGLILVLSVLSRLVSSRSEVRPFIVNSALLVITALAVFAPVARYALEQPGIYWQRTNQAGLQDGYSLELLANNAKKAVLMFNWQGAPGSEVLLHVGVVNVPGRSPQLDYLTGAAFALGVGALALFWLLRRRGLNAYAGLALLILLVPAISSTWGQTSSLRSAGIIPLVFAVAALPLYMGYEFLTKAFGRAGLLLALPLLGVTLAVIGFVNHDTYFGDYADFNARHENNLMEVAAVFRDFEEAGGDLDKAYVKRGAGIRIDTNILPIVIGDIDWRNAFVDVEAATEHAQNPEAKLYAVGHDDEPSLRRLEEIYPQGITYKFESGRPGPDRDVGFFVLLVPAEGEAAVTPLPNTHLVR